MVRPSFACECIAAYAKLLPIQAPHMFKVRLLGSR